MDNKKRKNNGTLLSFTNECTGLTPSQQLGNLDLYYYKKIYDNLKPKPKDTDNQQLT